MILGTAKDIRERILGESPFVIVTPTYKVYLGATEVASGVAIDDDTDPMNHVLSFSFTPALAGTHRAYFYGSVGGEPFIFGQDVVVRVAPPLGSGAVAPPSPEDVRDWTGLTYLLLDDLDELDLDTLIEKHINKTETEVALGVGEAFFDRTDLTARQAAALTQAWAYRTAVSFLQQPYLQKATGTHSPLMFEPSEAILAVKEEMTNTADRLESLAQTGAGTSAPWMRPSVRSSTFTSTSGINAGYNRDISQDEITIPWLRNLALP